MPTKTVQPGKSLGKRILDNWQLYLLLAVPVVLTKEYLNKKCGLEDLIQVYQDAYDRCIAAE